MGLIVKGTVGPSAAFGADGTEMDVYSGPQGEFGLVNTHGRFFEPSRRGKLWSGGNQGAQAVSVALATTYTGLCLFNPVSSGVLLSILRVKFALTVAPAAIASLHLINGYAATGGVTAQTALLTAQNALLGNGKASAGVLLSQATITTPKYLESLEDGFTAAALKSPTPPVPVEGFYTLLPGAYIAIGALTAVTGIGSIQWEEIALS